VADDVGVLEALQRYEADVRVVGVPPRHRQRRVLEPEAEEEVFVRGRKAALESLEGADALMKAARTATDVEKARHSTQG